MVIHSNRCLRSGRFPLGDAALVLAIIGGLLALGGTALRASSAQFVRGDANGDLALDIADPILTLAHLFSGGAMPCHDAADSNDDGALNVADPVHTLGYLFSSTPAPPAPFPACGPDPTTEILDCASPPAACGGGPGVPGDHCEIAIVLLPGVTVGSWQDSSDDYDASGCLGFTTSGGDIVYLFTLPNGMQAVAMVTPNEGQDPAIYLVAGDAVVCLDSPLPCVDAADDAGSSGAESVSYANATGSPIDVFLVVDSIDPAVAGEFTVSLAIASP